VAMQKHLRRRFWYEAGFAVAAGVLAVVTLFAKDWIETVFRIDPDHGNGSLEWVIVAALAVGSCVLSFVARAEWRRPAIS
jgi:hypothetical protein